MKGMGHQTKKRLAAEIAAAAPPAELPAPTMSPEEVFGKLGEIEALLGILKGHDLQVLGTPQRWAIFSKDGLYRYALVTEVNPAGSGANAFVGLNPSDATHEVADNTHTKCMEFARRWGFRYNWMLNAFGIRNKDRRVLRHVADPVGPANNDLLAFAAKHCNQIVAAWGADAKLLARGARVRRDLLAAGAALRVFRFNTDGSPEHPLYMPYGQPLVEWA
jgi:hypothetical protein